MQLSNAQNDRSVLEKQGRWGSLFVLNLRVLCVLTVVAGLLILAKNQYQHQIHAFNSLLHEMDAAVDRFFPANTLSPNSSDSKSPFYSEHWIKDGAPFHQVFLKSDHSNWSGFIYPEASEQLAQSFFSQALVLDLDEMIQSERFLAPLLYQPDLGFLALERADLASDMSELSYLESIQWTPGWHLFTDERLVKVVSISDSSFLFFPVKSTKNFFEKGVITPDFKVFDVLTGRWLAMNNGESATADEIDVLTPSSHFLPLATGSLFLVTNEQTGLWLLWLGWCFIVCGSLSFFVSFRRHFGHLGLADYPLNQLSSGSFNGLPPHDFCQNHCELAAQPFHHFLSAYFSAIQSQLNSDYLNHHLLNERQREFIDNRTIQQLFLLTYYHHNPDTPVQRCIVSDFFTHMSKALKLFPQLKADQINCHIESGATRSFTFHWFFLYHALFSTVSDFYSHGFSAINFSVKCQGHQLSLNLTVNGLEDRASWLQVLRMYQSTNPGLAATQLAGSVDQPMLLASLLMIRRSEQHDFFLNDSGELVLHFVFDALDDAEAIPLNLSYSSINWFGKAATANMTESATSEAAHVLVVEDNPVNQKVFAKQLVKLGYSCEIAERGEVGLEMLMAAPDKYAVVLMDSHLPGMDGFECARRIHTLVDEGTLQPLPIISVSANLDSTNRELARKAGMDYALAKPYQLAELSELLSKVLKSEEITPAPKQSAAQTAIDPTLLDFTILDSIRALDDDQTAFGEILYGYLDDAQKKFNLLEFAYNNKQTVDFKELAHTLKGASAVVGAIAVRNQFAVCEKCAGTGTLPSLEIWSLTAETFHKTIVVLQAQLNA